jgi:ABC-type Mn2+/Zn2+ transport system permease subunit
MLSVCAGMAGSFIWDTPTGPTIVVSAAVFFEMSQVFNAVVHKDDQ